jgi:hypothetical protein
MLRPALAAIGLTFALLGPAMGQQLPAYIPNLPQGGPIIGPDGKVISGLDKTPNPWSGAFQIGASGSEGNVSILKGVAGLDVRYDTPDDFMTFNGIYVLTRYNDSVIEQKALGTLRNEVIFADPFAWYLEGQAEYDQFRDIDFRLAAHNGLSYALMKSSDSVLKIRAGFGTAKEFGGDRNTWFPEGQLGGDFELGLSTRSRLSLSADYYPGLQNFDRYRVRGRASFDIMLDPSLNLLLRLGVMERYDSMPLNSKRNDLDYFATLLFQF